MSHIGLNMVALAERSCQVQGQLGYMKEKQRKEGRRRKEEKKREEKRDKIDRKF